MEQRAPRDAHTVPAPLPAVTSARDRNEALMRIVVALESIADAAHAGTIASPARPVVVDGRAVEASASPIRGAGGRHIRGATEPPKPVVEVTPPAPPKAHETPATSPKGASGGDAGAGSFLPGISGATEASAAAAESHAAALPSSPERKLLATLQRRVAALESVMVAPDAEAFKASLSQAELHAAADQKTRKPPKPKTFQDRARDCLHATPDGFDADAQSVAMSAAAARSRAPPSAVIESVAALSLDFSLSQCMPTRGRGVSTSITTPEHLFRAADGFRIAFTAAFGKEPWDSDLRAYKDTLFNFAATRGTPGSYRVRAAVELDFLVRREFEAQAKRLVVDGVRAAEAKPPLSFRALAADAQLRATAALERYAT